MRIAQINCVCGGGSTGRTSAELAAYLASHGHDCRVYYSEGTCALPFAVRYISDRERKLHAALSRLTGLQGYFSQAPTRRLIRMLEAYAPDAVHLRVLHGNGVCLPTLFAWLRKKRVPVVVTLHDFWLLTGKCTHPQLFCCEKYTSVCGDCPALKGECPSLFFDFSEKMQRDRARWFRALIDYRVVGVSDWSAGVAKRASCVDPARVLRIYNWIDTGVFRPQNAAPLRERLGLTGRFVLLAVSARWDGVRAYKGLPALLTLLGRLPEDCTLLLIGNLAPDTALPPRVVSVPQVDDAGVLAGYYAAADVFVNLSQVESFGKTTAEALCCGTPAVAYALAASPELIGPGCGYAVPYEEGVAGVEKRVLEIRQKGKAAYTAACTAFARRAFEPDANEAAYVALYEGLQQTKGND